MKEFFVLVVPKGSILHRADGSSVKIDDIPEDVFELWKSGASVFALKSTGKSLIEGLSVSEIEDLIKIREPFDYLAELKILKNALKSFTPKNSKEV